MNDLFTEENLTVAMQWVFLAAWRSLPIVAIVFAIDLLLRRRIAAKFYCLLWSLVIVHMMMPFSMPSDLSIHGPIDWAVYRTWTMEFR